MRLPKQVFWNTLNPAYASLAGQRLIGMVFTGIWNSRTERSNRGTSAWPRSSKGPHCGKGIATCSRVLPTPSQTAHTVDITPTGARLSALRNYRMCGAGEDLRLPDKDARFRLPTFEAKWCSLIFWAAWCQPCRKEMPGYQELADRYGSR